MRFLWPIAREAVRHSLRKSVWVRLLSPTQALARLHDGLDPEDELPSEASYAMRPLWEVLLRFPKCKLCWKAWSERRRRINMSELRAFLRSERRQGLRHPESRCLRASDSQVTLGCVQKGRSSGVALNQELQQSLANVLGNDIYSEGMQSSTLRMISRVELRFVDPAFRSPHGGRLLAKGGFIILIGGSTRLGKLFLFNGASLILQNCSVIAGTHARRPI